MINENNKSVLINFGEKYLNSPRDTNLKVQNIQCITLDGNINKIHNKEKLSKKEILRNLYEKDEKVNIPFLRKKPKKN
jgi:hypothetical protein